MRKDAATASIDAHAKGDTGLKEISTPSIATQVDSTFGIKSRLASETNSVIARNDLSLREKDRCPNPLAIRLEIGVSRPNDKSVLGNCENDVLNVIALRSNSLLDLLSDRMIPL